MDHPEIEVRLKNLEEGQVKLFERIDKLDEKLTSLFTNGPITKLQIAFSALKARQYIVFAILGTIAALLLRGILDGSLR